MKLDDIFNEWSKDSQISLLDITGESVRTGSLHAKYWRLLSTERLILTRLETEHKTLIEEKRNFFMDGEDEETRAKGWQLPPKGRIIHKDEAMRLVLIEKDVIDLTLKISMYKEKVELLKSIIDRINKREFTIANIIKWKKWEQGE